VSLRPDGEDELKEPLIIQEDDAYVSKEQANKDNMVSAGVILRKGLIIFDTNNNYLI